MRINIERLLRDVEKYSYYGRDDLGGVTRPCFSPPDQQLRNVFVDELVELGLEVVIDPAANIWGKLKGTGKKSGNIVIGSHLDSVPNGGKYDGALGVLIAKECFRTLKESSIFLDHDVEIVSFTGEESNDFNLSTFGSRSFTGQLTPEMLGNVQDSNGVRLRDALASVGGDLNQFSKMRHELRHKKAFIELHIEQGQRLEAQNQSIAIVDRAVGVIRKKVTVTGAANHSGTTMMVARHDALAAAAEMILAVERISKEHPTDLVGTVGKLLVFPNAPNIVPGQVQFILEVRGGLDTHINDTIRAIDESWRTISLQRQVGINQETILSQKPVFMDEDLVHILQETATEFSIPCSRLASMAVHDAVHMASITKAVMIFVKSIGGKSHCPEEYSTTEDIEVAANLMLHGIINVDAALN